MEVVLNTNLPGVGAVRRGKVRDIYDLGEHLLLVVTDRVSAFDVVLPLGIPDKGRILTQISLYWFEQMKDIVANHVVATEVSDFPAALRPHRHLLEGRSILVRKAQVLPVECIVRGYLSGSGWKSYRKNGTVCGIGLPAGMVESDRIAGPIFTPSTKAEEGHDINIPFDEMTKIVGPERADWLKEKTLAVYARAAAMAENKGIIIADTKMEFGLLGDEIIIIDELLTPDSSRFWSARDYEAGRGQDSYDKQIIRDYLLTLDWDQTPPGPELPATVVAKAAGRYREILDILTG